MDWLAACLTGQGGFGGWVGAWLAGCLVGWMDGWMVGYVDVFMLACMHGSMDGWVGVWMDVMMHGRRLHSSCAKKAAAHSVWFRPPRGTRYVGPCYTGF